MAFVRYVSKRLVTPPSEPHCLPQDQMLSTTKNLFTKFQHQERWDNLKVTLLEDVCPKGVCVGIGLGYRICVEASYDQPDFWAPGILVSVN